jgi:hypothetical protein
VAVGIERRENDHDRRIQRSSDLGLVGGGEQVKELGRRLRAADLRRVDAHADRNNRRLPFDDRGGGLFVEGPRIGQAKCVGANLIEAGDVFGRRDDRGDELAALRCRTGVDELDPIGRGGDGFEIALQRRPVGELAVGAHAEAECGLGCLDGRRRLRAGVHRKDRDEEQCGRAHRRHRTTANVGEKKRGDSLSHPLAGTLRTEVSL